MEQKFKRQSIELGGDLPSVMVSKVARERKKKNDIRKKE